MFKYLISIPIEQNGEPRKGYDRVSVMRPRPGDKVRLLKSFSAICTQSVFLVEGANMFVFKSVENINHI